MLANGNCSINNNIRYNLLLKHDKLFSSLFQKQILQQMFEYNVLISNGASLILGGKYNNYSPFGITIHSLE
jgi:hypothetical protein